MSQSNIDQQDVSLLRKVVDECDEQLVNLVARRQQAVRQLVAHKKRSGEAIFVPRREQEILERLTDKAKQQSLDPSLIHDLLQRLMRDSYTQQSNMEYPASTTPKKICIVGGEGQFGQLLVEQFTRSGHHVESLEPQDWTNAEHLFSDVNLVLLSVPIDNTVDVIRRLGDLPKDCVLADITSIKSAPLAEMLAVHPGPVIGFHPMFGPRLDHLARQLLLYTPGRDLDQCLWVIEQFALWGCYVQEIDAQDHDQLMAVVQGLRHFVTFVAGWHLQNNQVDISRLMQVGSPLYSLELALIGRLFAQQPEMYIDIILNANGDKRQFDDYRKVFEQATEWVLQGDREKLIQQFRTTADYFEEWQLELLNQSDIVLESYRERVTKQRNDG